MTQQPPTDRNVNPDYGDGLYRRRIRLLQRGDHVLGELEDDCHGFRVRVAHDGESVTAVDAETLRVPLTTCGGAVRPLQELVGMRLDTMPSAIVRSVDPRRNCTHLYDLALLALGHGLREGERRYDVEVEDRPRDDTAARAEVFLDGKPVHRWHLDWTTIVEPESLAGRPVLHGFAAWANEAFTGVEQEAAFVLSKGVFVSLSRLYDMANVAGRSALENESMRGVCFSYSDGVMERARYLGTNTRDFSDTPELLLRFR